MALHQWRCTSAKVACSVCSRLGSKQCVNCGLRAAERVGLICVPQIARGGFGLANDGIKLSGGGGRCVVPVNGLLNTGGQCREGRCFSVYREKIPVPACNSVNRALQLFVNPATAQRPVGS